MHRRNLVVWVVGTTLLLGVAAQALEEGAPASIPSREQGTLAALDDSSNEVVAKALELLLNDKKSMSPRVHNRLQELIRAPRMRGLLQDGNGFVRQVAASALGAMSEAAQDQAPLLGPLLKDSKSEVRVAAARALGAMGEAAKDQAPLLVPLLKDSRGAVRDAAARALGAMGEAAKDQAPLLAPLLKDSDEGVRRAAALALGAMGEAAKDQAPLLVPLLKDASWAVSQAAAQALGAICEAAKDQAPLLIPLLKDSDEDVREAAVQALGAMGEAAKDQAPLLVPLLKDSDEAVRAAAKRALKAIGKAAKNQAPHFAPLLKDLNSGVSAAAWGTLGSFGAPSKDQVPFIVARLKDPDGYARAEAARDLGTLGEAAKDQVPLLVPLLKDADGDVRAAAAQALGAMGEAAKDQAPLLAPLLKDSDEAVRAAAVWALGAMGETARDQALLVVSLLKDSNWAVRNKATEALLMMVPLDGLPVAAILAETNDDPSQRTTWLLRTHLAGGGDASIERVIQWVGRSTSDERPQQLTLKEARETLRAFAGFWPYTESYQTLRKDLSEQIANVARDHRGQWESTDIELLELHVKNLRSFQPRDAETVQAAIDRLERWKPMARLGWAWAGHIVFWVLLLFFYPRSPKVQAFFFWNPWVRTITGLVYVGLLLTWVPFLRRRLMAPFSRLLLADADLERFSREVYFDRSEVLTPSSKKPERLLSALPRLQGQVVLEGASGLGKSMFLRYLLRNSKGLAVYLPAERCKDGVIEAIQAKLEGQAKDTGFLQSIIYSGALDIYIDGLNEVTADTRARIVQFVERNSHGNILLSTQRIEWTPPKTARLYVLQPLSEDAISEFLVSREPTLGEKSKLRGDAYRQACERFMKEALSPEQPEKVHLAMREVLSNPMDLTVVAQMLADGHLPELSHLRQQQYELMAKDYAEVHLAEFPLKEFAEESYRMRSEDRTTLSEERFARELLRMEDFKMVLRRQWKGPDDKERREWRFRHDKIQEFFIAQTFLGDENLRVLEHMSDPRFRGVYFLLAFMLPMEKARQLRDLLVEHAAETRDNTLVNDFVLLLKSREGAEKARAPEATVTPIRQTH